MAVRQAFENLRNLFLTRICPGCGTGLAGLEGTLCSWCSLRLYRNTSAGSVSVPDGMRTHSVFQHCGLPREIIIRLKYMGERHLARCAAALMSEYSPVLPSANAMLVPVPTSRKRLRERGYNHAGLIALHLSRITGSGFEKLLKREERPPQVGLSVEERRANVEGAFSMRGRIDDGCEIWLVDDVMTTGSTLSEASRALFEGGADSVSAITLTYRDTLSVSMI
jgi:ComF family protein